MGEYNKHTWVIDEIITDSKLNNMEDGISNAHSTRYYPEDFANIDSPEFTGTPTAPTPDTTDNSQQIATTAFVQELIAQLKEELQGSQATI